MEKVAAVYVAIGDLVPWNNNPRLNRDAIAPVADSIRRFGFGAPILARAADRRIISGHTRYEAAILLGLAEVPVRYLDLSEYEAAALALADNRLGEIAEWDTDRLARLLLDLDAHDVKVDDLGWSEADLDGLLAAYLPTPAPGETSPDAAEGPDVVDFKFGDYSGKVPRAAYSRFVEAYKARKSGGSEVMFGDVIASWLGLDGRA